MEKSEEFIILFQIKEMTHLSFLLTIDGPAIYTLHSFNNYKSAP